MQSEVRKPVAKPSTESARVVRGRGGSCRRCLCGISRKPARENCRKLQNHVSNLCQVPYIGQTGWSLRHRLAEHRQALKNGRVAASALAKHSLDTGHPLDISKAEVIDHHSHIMPWCLLESWHIQKNQGTLNRYRKAPYLWCTMHSYSNVL